MVKLIERLTNKIDSVLVETRYPNCVGCKRTKRSCDRHIKCTKHPNGGCKVEWK